VSPTGNVSTSVLKMIPDVNDHGKSLICRAENSRLGGSAIEDTWKLAVFCQYSFDRFFLSLFVYTHTQLSGRKAGDHLADSFTSSSSVGHRKNTFIRNDMMSSSPTWMDTNSFPQV